MSDQLVRPGIQALTRLHGSPLNRAELLTLSKKCQEWADAKTAKILLSGCNYEHPIDASRGLTVRQHFEEYCEEIKKWNQKPYSAPLDTDYFITWFSTLYDLTLPVKFIRVWAVKSNRGMFGTPAGQPNSQPVPPFTELTDDYIPKGKDQILVLSNQ